MQTTENTCEFQLNSLDGWETDKTPLDINPPDRILWIGVTWTKFPPLDKIPGHNPYPRIQEMLHRRGLRVVLSLEQGLTILFAL